MRSGNSILIPMEIIGHRGAKGLAIENTLDAFKKALRFDVDAIETDLRIQNGIIVLSHEATLKSETYTKLDELLKLVNGKIPINLEVKEAKVVPLLKKTLSSYEGKIVFSSFDYGILKKIKKLSQKEKLQFLKSGLEFAPYRLLHYLGLTESISIKLGCGATLCVH
jgi:glycerophosphoryl diester phosphodiesterase